MFTMANRTAGDSASIPGSLTLLLQSITYDDMESIAIIGDGNSPKKTGQNYYLPAVRLVVGLWVLLEFAEHG